MTAAELELQFRRRRQPRRRHQQPGREDRQRRPRRIDRGQPGGLGEPRPGLESGRQPDDALQHRPFRRDMRRRTRPITFLDQNSGSTTTATADSDGCLQHHGSARDRVEHVHGDDAGCVRSIDPGRDHAGGLFAAGVHGANLEQLVGRGRIADSTPILKGRRGGEFIRLAGLSLSLRVGNCACSSGVRRRHPGPVVRGRRGAAPGRRARRWCRSGPGPTPPRRGRPRLPSDRRAARPAERSPRRRPRCAEHQRGIAQQPRAFRHAQGRSRRAWLSIPQRLQRQPLDQVGIGPLRTRVELRFATGRGLAVPGTDVLADVAAKDPAVQLAPRSGRRARPCARSSSN